ncbi:hypothetical protein MASR2M78_36040 [Treponema sp.]
MAKSNKMSLVSAITERFTDVWKLLSETTYFLSRTPDFASYETQLRTWRAELQLSRTDSETAQRIRSELVELRKGLRLQGYDLSLAKQELKFDGFRNDACIREGFKRIVIFFTDKDLYYLVGDDNHVALSNFLESRLETIGVNRIRDRHYLWYKRNGNELVLSGSDTETKDDFERLVGIGEHNSLLLLGKLKGLH